MENAQILHQIMTSMLLGTFAGVLGFISVGFILSRILKRNDIADFLWGLGFIAIAMLHFFEAGPLDFRATLVLGLTLLWGLRLSLHLGIRTFGSQGEDIRYANWRKDWGKSEPLMALLKVFALQGMIMGIIALPLAWVLRMPSQALTPWDFIGTAAFILGFVFEALSDAQLAEFKKKPENKGKVMNQGLWALSRHPNYFGEVLIWWGLFLISLPLPYGLFTVLSPLLITLLLTKVSGVPMLEKVLAAKGEDFRKYVQATPSFFPFRLRSVFTFAIIIVALGALDFLWLGVVMRDFYREETAAVARIAAGQWHVLPWAAILVYFFIALGVQFFAVRASKLESGFRGALLGLCAYGIYEFTNLALVANWPWKMALADLLWGPVLCSFAAVTGSWHLHHPPKLSRPLTRAVS